MSTDLDNKGQDLCLTFAFYFKIYTYFYKTNYKSRPDVFMK